ncbi:MAG: hypothetical protein KGJ09_01125 [Candidatus Omnitrophica bacterium]|nr:hypothetical protein [Candidatus Omnitrophota bacterium]MDE2008661.1 hypothetical protein [Candidatus Omnitrophota bacterium]MDE2214956.1 hypothetical protein [Candidatus Omnitrophota bacterium]MDE2230895.1 hypothetical protein [Candidatus Omnitrophota bacterium]
MGVRIPKSFILILVLLTVPWTVHAQSAPASPPAAVKSAATNDDCLACHGDATQAPFVDQDKFQASVHGKQLCTDCHTDLVGSDFPHKTAVALVDCGRCHTRQEALFSDSIHGRARARGDKLAPECFNCHGNHYILPVKDPNSTVAPFHIPFVCGSCHSEGKPVSQQRQIPEKHILENYSDSMHGEALLKKGLNVTATCASCHRAHDILPFTDPRSSIARANIVKTCLQCHSQIERVHRKIINGKLWEKNPQVIPVCVDCHQPHKIRRVYYPMGEANQDCLTCHGKKTIVSSKDHRSLFIDEQQFNGSVHAKVACAQCHTQVSASHTRPCETITKRVDCSICHSQQVAAYRRGTHGKLWSQGNPNAPSCRVCHGTHGILSHKDIRSPTYPTNIPALCARCHREGHKAAVLYKGPEHNITTNYIESIHGQGLLESGLVVAATCVSCHTAHEQLPAADPRSTVNRRNIARTCSQCHQGVYEKYMKSVHAIGRHKDSARLPACNDCHTAHTIKRTDENAFRFDIMNTCGKCHQAIASTYFQTVHGKISKLGYAKAAKCQDCHGSHEIFPVTDPRSTLSYWNIVHTCQKCHAGANRRFAGYLTHATHHDPKKYPWIFWTFWAMTALLVGTFSVSLFHTLLWLPKSLEMRRLYPQKHIVSTEKQYVRFPVFYRVLHIIMICSFLTLTITGMTLKFSYTPWALFISKLLGGYAVSGFLHRCAAVTLLGIFFAHLRQVFLQKRLEKRSFKEMLFGPDTILFTKKDWREFLVTVKWYMGKGPYPQYGRWTYWEKFDYFAVLWGVMVIGTSGLMLWFPEAFTHVLPGWVINVATIVHSDEALLAAGFIFTVHFFNTHFRPEKFPMDTVIFTGRMSIEDLKRERPKEYEALVARGELEKNLAEPLSPGKILAIRIFGWTALSLGLVLVVCIIFTMIFGYK